MVITDTALTFSLNIDNCSRSFPENLIDLLVSHCNVQNTVCYILFLGVGVEIQTP